MELRLSEVVTEMEGAAADLQALQRQVRPQQGPERGRGLRALVEARRRWGSCMYARVAQWLLVRVYALTPDLIQMSLPAPRPRVQARSLLWRVTRCAAGWRSCRPCCTPPAWRGAG